MTKALVKIDESIDQEALDRAVMIHNEIAVRKVAIAQNMFEMGKLFKEMRDNKYYKYHGYDTFEEYIGVPELGLKRSTVYSLIQKYELYVQQLDISINLLYQIGHAKLQIINPVVQNDPSEWIYRAKELSRSDLKNEVRLAQGKPPLEIKKEIKDVYAFSIENYLGFIKARSCIVCGEGKTEACHFPKSKGAGGRESDCIPLCRKCHTESHQDLYDWLWINRDKIFRYFYDLILEAYEIIREAKK